MDEWMDKSALRLYMDRRPHSSDRKHIRTCWRHFKEKPGSTITIE